MVIQQLIVVISFLTFVPSVINGLKYIAVGDWGIDNSDQYNVANTMNNWCSPDIGWGPCDFILGLGDNFYEEGVTSVNDPRFNTTWKFVYDKPNLRNLVWYQTLGNNDYHPNNLDNRELFQSDYTAVDSKWYMPWIFYDFQIIDENGVRIHFIALDTQALTLRKHDWQAQLTWLEDTLATSTADWKVVFGHHSPYSSGDKQPGSETLQQYVVPLLNRYQVELFVCAHEHNHERVTSAQITDYLVTGGGGAELYPYDSKGEDTLNGWGLTLNYFGFHFGFASIEMTMTSYAVQIVDETGAVRYSYQRVK